MPNPRNAGKESGAGCCQIAAHIPKGGVVDTFTEFLDHVLKNFASSLSLWFVED